MEEQERKFKGVWIPKEVWLNSELSLLEKIIYTEIDSFCSNDEENEIKNSFYGSNKYLADFCQCSESKVSKAIKKLNDKNLIEVLSFNGRTRIIQSRLAKNAMQTSKKCYADQQKVLPININNNIEYYKENNISKDIYKRKIENEPPYEKIIDYVNNCGEKNSDMFTKIRKFNFSPETKNTRKLIKALWKQKYTIEDFRYVIACKYDDFIEHERLFDKTMSSKYYNPATLFADSNFSKYLEEAKQMYDE